MIRAIIELFYSATVFGMLFAGAMVLLDRWEVK